MLKSISDPLKDPRPLEKRMRAELGTTKVTGSILVRLDSHAVTRIDFPLLISSRWKQSSDRTALAVGWC